MARIRLYKKVAQCLHANPEQRMTAREIAIWIVENCPDYCTQKRQETTQDLSSNAALIGQISAEIRPSHVQAEPRIKIIAGRPRKFYWSEKTDAEEVSLPSAPIAESIPQTGIADQAPAHLSEADLYPLLAEFLYYELGIYSKRIDERRSKNNSGKNGNKWLHPDIVGVEDLGKEWNKAVRDCAKSAFAEHILLWSFEVKPKINRSSLREYFFQTVSNSSWAHYGYLVAAELNEDAKAELELLCKAHGIGFILLNAENPAESEIKIPASDRDDVDWDTADRIAKENPDFKEYLELVRDVHNGMSLKRQKGWYEVK